MQSEYYYKSPIGWLHIKSDGEVINGIHFIDDEQPGISANQISGDKPVVAQCISQLEEYFAGTRLVFTFPVMQAGTSFQQSVWDALLTIPPGKTKSYLELSKQIGNVKAIRAVGLANGKNNIAIAVPCHRVIGANGNLVGYAGGLWRKKWLLDHEATHANGVQHLFTAHELQ